MRHFRTRSLTLTVTALAAALLAGTGQAGAQQEGAPGKTTIAHGTFAAYGPGQAAVTYDETLVPEGAMAGVLSVTRSHLGTITKLGVHGLVPNRAYGAHVHTKPCGPTGEAAGPHFQHVQGPSDDPAYANPENEIWLDFTTNAAGTGFAASRVDWTFGERRPESVVIHDHHTSTAPGEAGSAGPRLACLNVDF
ncbi:superoxide dismutase family protein [Prauserella muralis]|uniref:Superoxide dismutase n=1 Tax=Prauserella muralis TaxID=588067 RepID=A0A2V4B7P5_9PSEU|nr:superoxide dismutase family protein [Prauserella muralis]PXY31405.1 superoxide dismutase [Prauserella muralis]TWE14266.1 Cu-Zn family superoxide dismutase [Prauserella muralis]